MSGRLFRAGTRGSALALRQTQYVLDQLRHTHPHIECQVEVVTSRGDRDQQTPLPVLGGKGLFTAELEEGLRSGHMDLAVHSLKDLPIEDPSGLITAAVLARSEPRDVLVSRNGRTLDALPPNAVIGTSSTRRGAQILARRPDLLIRTIRGNVDTRLRKLDEGQYDAIVLAGAGVMRMGLEDRVSQWLPVTWFTPAPGQGALAVQCRADDDETLSLLASIHNQELGQCVLAERTFLAALGGGCSEPVGAFAELRSVQRNSLRVADAHAADGVAGQGDEPARPEGTRQTIFHLHAWYSSPDGQAVWCNSVEGDTPESVAKRAAESAQHVVSARNSHSNSFAAFETRPRVVLTRSATDDPIACRLLLTAGFQPILAPVVDMAPIVSPEELRSEVGAPGNYDWLLFTSANAVRILHELWAEQGGTAEDFRSCAVAAVGPATAQAAEQAGFQVSLVPETFSAHGLAVDAAQFQNRRVLVPRSALGSKDLIEMLERAGAQVTEISLYRPQTIQLDERTVQTLAQGFDVLTFASGSAARAFAAEANRYPALAGLMGAAKVACIGPQTASAVEEAGLPVHLISPVHTMEGLVQAITEQLFAANGQLSSASHLYGQTPVSAPEL